MSNRRRNIFILAFVALLIVASGIVVATKKTTLGLDLKGGTELIFQARPTPQNPTIDGADIDRAIEIIRKRTDAFGVSEPEISRIGSDSIRVGLPNVSNAAHASQEVGQTAQLQLYDWEPNVIPNPAKTNVQRSESWFSRLYDAVTLASKQQPNCFENKCTHTGPQYYLFNAQTHAWIAGPTDTQKDLFSELPGQKQPANTQVIAVPQGTIVVEKEGDNGQPAPDDPNDTTAKWFVIRDRPALSGTDIKDPKPSFDQFDQPTVTFNFTDKGRQEFADTTRAIAQRGLQNAPPGIAGNSQAADAYSGHFAIVLDQQIKSRPIINFVDNPDGIDGSGGAEINGLTAGESNDLAQILQIGALPVDLTQISSSTVSATLGQEALDQGLKAGIVGLIFVCLFLLAYYRFLGFVAVVGLAIYGLIFFALIKLIPITLTLPGIAGLILTIGVAADANIVIFERIKEEARSGKSMLSAIAVGYRRGIATIIDANVITLITAFILFALATANVKGFAFTLGVGTIASLFTAVVFTQAFLGLFGRARFMRSPAALGAHTEQRVRWHFDFSRASKYFFTLSGCILLVGALSFATKQLNLGIDFEGGSRITVGLQKAATVDDVRSTVEGGRDQRLRDHAGLEQGARDERLRDRLEGEPRRGPERPAGPSVQVRHRPRRLQRDDGRPDLRPAGGEERDLRDHLLPAGDLRLRRVPVRAEVRGAGDHRGDPRHPDHGRRLFADGEGGDQRYRRRVPDHPGVLALRHGHRLRPNTRERAAAAARDLLPDRQPLHERGSHPVADHGCVERLPGDGAVHLRRRDVEGLRLRDDDRAAVGYVLVDLHRIAGAHALEGARTGLPPPPRAHRGADGPCAGVPGGKRGRANRGRSRGADPGRDAGARRPCPEPLAGPRRRSGTARTRPTAARARAGRAAGARWGATGRRARRW